MEHFLAGQLACLRELTLCFAPNVNSYKRFVPGSFAPTAVAWGVDNRTCALRVVGDGPSVHVETRVPGGDVNPYVAVAALLAAGLHGIEHELPLEPPVTGNAYAGDAPRVPSTLTAATELFEQSAVARAGVRRRRRRPLRARGARRARRLRVRRHRLGAHPWLRTPLTGPVDARLAGPGRGDHRRRERHRPGVGTPPRERRRAHRDRRPRRRHRHRRRRPRSTASSWPST